MGKILSKVSTYSLLPLVSYSLPIFGGGIGFVGGFVGGFMIAPREPIDSIIFLKGSSDWIISIFVNAGFAFVEVMFCGIPGGLVGGLIGILIGSYLKTKFDDKFGKPKDESKE
jgi:hypothetical protein